MENSLLFNFHEIWPKTMYYSTGTTLKNPLSNMPRSCRKVYISLFFCFLPFIENIKTLATDDSATTEPTGAIENPDSDEKRVFDGHHFVPESNDKEDSTQPSPSTQSTESTTEEVRRILDGRHLVPANGTEDRKTMPRGPPLNLEHNKQQQAIVKAFKHAWKAYKESAWGKDELKPVSHTSSTWFNLGLTLVDSLDTMWLMGLTEEFKEARDWVENDMVVAQNKDVNLFETTIRVLGGLLSAYHLTKDHMFLEKAVSCSHLFLPPLSPPSLPLSLPPSLPPSLSLSLSLFLSFSLSFSIL